MKNCWFFQCFLIFCTKIEVIINPAVFGWFPGRFIELRPVSTWVSCDCVFWLLPFLFGEKMSKKAGVLKKNVVYQPLCQFGPIEMLRFYPFTLSCRQAYFQSICQWLIYPTWRFFTYLPRQRNLSICHSLLLGFGTFSPKILKQYYEKKYPNKHFFCCTIISLSIICKVKFNSM